MSAILFDSKMGDELRRVRVFDGDLLLFSATAGTKELVEFARRTIQESIPKVDPQTAQSTMAVEDFVAIVAPLKTKFTNHQHTQVLVQGLLTAFGCYLEKTYFDVPRLRVVTHGGYLSAGVGYAYKPQ